VRAAWHRRVFLASAGGHDFRSSRVGEVAAQFGGDVDVQHVAGPDHPVARDAVRGLLVDADAGRAREAIGKPRRRAGAVAFEEPPADGVQLARGHAGLRGVEHLVQHH